MCDPITLGITAVALTGVSAVASGIAAKKQGDFAEAVGNYNAKTGEMKAQQAVELGAVEEQQHRARVRQMIGAQRAAEAGSGAVVDSGSFGDIADDTARAGEFDALQIRSNAARSAWAYRSQAEIDRSEGAAAASAGRWAMAGSLLTGASQAFGMAYQMKSPSSGGGSFHPARSRVR